MFRKLLVVLLLVGAIPAWSITPVTPNTGFIPAGTVIKKVVGSDTFAFDEMSPSGEGSTVSGYVAVATKTFSIPAAGKTNIGALVPSGSHGFRVRVFGDSVIFNCTSGLSTGTFSVGDEVASGSVYTWDGPGHNGDIYCAPKNGSAATGTMWAW